MKLTRVEEPDILTCDRFAARPLDIAGQLDLDAWIESLPEEEREFVTLLLQGHGQAEAARRCGRHPNTLQRFTERLRRRLASDWPKYFGPGA